MLSTLSQNPPTARQAYHGPRHTVAKMTELAQGPRGEQSMVVRSMVEDIVRALHPKDYLGEILAIRYWGMQRIRYLNDPLHIELLKDPQRIIEEVRSKGLAIADCDEIACTLGAMALCLGREAEFVIAGFGSDGSFSHVFIRVKEPKTKQWVVCDPVAGTGERRMLEKVAVSRMFSLDERPGA